jgi:hypothetical protein
MSEAAILTNAEVGLSTKETRILSRTIGRCVVESVRALVLRQLPSDEDLTSKYKMKEHIPKMDKYVNAIMEDIAELGLVEVMAKNEKEVNSKCGTLVSDAFDAWARFSYVTKAVDKANDGAPVYFQDYTEFDTENAFSRWLSERSKRFVAKVLLPNAIHRDYVLETDEDSDLSKTDDDSDDSSSDGSDGSDVSGSEDEEEAKSYAERESLKIISAQ